MDYYQSSSSGSSRGRSSYRGSSFRGSSRGDSYRGSRGSSRGYMGYSPRGRGGSSSYYPSKYESSPKYSSNTESSKYASSSSYGRYEDCYRRSDSSFGREHRSDLSDLASRKRDRSESYSSSQGVARRSHEADEYRSSRYSSSSYPEPRSYDDRSFKKPRVADYKPAPEYRAKEPLRTRAPRGRPGLRGTLSRRARGDAFGVRRRALTSRASTTASTSEILAIRRAKLLQNRLKQNTVSSSADGKEKTEKKESNTESETVSAKAEEAQPGDGEAKEQVAKEEAERTTYYGRPYVKLLCPACDTKCVTFKEYSTHLYSPVHVRAMKEKSESMKSSLAAMRIEQRDKQKELDENDLTSMNTRTYFCAICKLNYSQERSTHKASELHKKLEDFLMPYCKICHYQCQTPLMFENHICSLEHLRRKHDAEEREKKKSSAGILDKFMVLDSVGSGDEGDEKEDEGIKVEKEEDLLLGGEFIRDIKAKYCEVCRVYLPRVKDYERVIKRHCRTKDHLRCYLHYGNEALLEKMHADDDNASDTKAEKNGNEGAGEGKEGESEEPLDGDKLWDGLGELLDEAQPQVKSDDEDEEEGGRFDRFKSKEKQENGDVSVEEVVKSDVPPGQQAPQEPPVLNA